MGIKLRLFRQAGGIRLLEEVCQGDVGSLLAGLGESRRTKHVRFNDLRDPEAIPRGTDFSSVIDSDVPIVVQHTRLDSRQSANALLSTIAFSEG